MKNKIIFEKQYSALELDDIDRDVYTCFDPDFNDEVVDLPIDEYGLPKGHFKLTIEFIGE